ncbi:TetR/AcrR family transcriptional regulator [Phototrophicus methaneseepsis]|uniref:TetR/AcrR family transcriptional regulator n=1 Tax=Phototrophicus methaneseepsis TaxID=2710758 RepID=A0A7S8ECI0_9CHLR|nr:TetR/AcrR family transcriptional regulator [Phototrophicus methaneseepsis]QPC84218.1 TetR/AcrR family transcriptional regulator [Phototrophicus methaneseepsis]
MTEAEKRIAILNATLELIAEHGFHGAPIAKIAKKSGVSAGIIYHYFADKDDLIYGLYIHIKKEHARALLSQNLVGLPFPQNLKQMWLNAYAYYVTHPKETLFLEQYENSPYPQSLSEEVIDKYFSGLMQMIKAACSQGRMVDLPLDVIYELTFRVAAGIAKKQISGILALSDEQLDEVAEACCRAVTH